MRKIGLYAFALAAAVACGSDNSNANVYVATMTSANETPPNSSTGTGAATFTVVNGTSVNYVITYQGLTGAPTAAHIHYGAAGQSNPPATTPFTLTAGSGATGTITGSFAAADVKAGPAGSGVVAGDLNSLITAMKAGTTYANVHTTANGGGEIRGQIHPK